MKLVFYGRLADEIAPELDIPANDISIAELRDRIAFEYPRAGATLRNRRARAVVDREMVADDYRVVASDRVEFLAPVSGG